MRHSEIHARALVSALADGEYVEVRPLNQRTGRPTPQQWVRTAPALLAAASRAVTAGDDVYVGVQPRARRSGGADAVSRLVWMVADVDHGTDGHARPSRHATREDALEAICATGIRPTILVHSGGGWQAWCRLAEAVDLATYQDAGRRYAHATGGDATVYDAPRILRLAGTYNRKLEAPRPVVVVEHSEAVTPIDAFLALPAPPVTVSPPERPVTLSWSGPVGGRPFDRANAVPIVEVLAWLGAKQLRTVGGRVYCVCPVHGSGANPSQMTVGTRSNVARCWGDCDRTYTAVDLVAAATGVTPRDAVQALARRFGFCGFREREQEARL